MSIKYREAVIKLRFRKDRRDWIAVAYHLGMKWAQAHDKDRLKAIAKVKSQIDVLLDE